MVVSHHRALTRSLETGHFMFCYRRMVVCNSLGKIIVDVSFIVPTRAVFILRKE